MKELQFLVEATMLIILAQLQYWREKFAQEWLIIIRLNEVVDGTMAVPDKQLVLQEAM